MAKRKERKKAILKNGSKDTDRSSSPIVGRKTGNGSQIRSGLCPKTKSSTCFRCTVPTLSGTATCLRTHRFGSTHDEGRPGFEPFPLGKRTQSNPSLKSSVRSTEQVT